ASFTLTNTVFESVTVTATHGSGNRSVSVAFAVIVQDTVVHNGLMFHRALSESEAIAAGFAPGATYTERGINGPAGMVVAKFSWANGDNFCRNVTMSGYSDWRLPTEPELSGLYAAKGNMYTSFGWPTTHYYWSSTPSGTGRARLVLLNNGTVNVSNAIAYYYVGCVRTD
ncbi:TPA: DUF1566 domain-containing protein, partial [Vibrio vulnificus]|nr:DUF1566 domain-containing protein [Vibrio vulnificus]